MCSPPMLEMSKPSIRTGSASSPSASWSDESASTRCARRRSWRSLSWASASTALRSASSRSRRFEPRSATRTSTGPPRRAESASASSVGALAQRRPDDHQPRDRRRGRVVLGEELLGHLGLVGLGLVGEVEAVALGEQPVADLEHLRVGLRALERDRDQVGVVERLAGDAAPLHQRAHRLEPVAEDGGALELLRVRGLGHLALEVALDVAVAAGEEVDDRVDPAPVLLAVDVADAGRRAALDVVVEAGDAGAAAGLRALAGAVLEQAPEQVEGLAHPLRRRVGAEVDPPRAVALAGEVDARELLVEADPDVRIGLVVAQADVELRPVALDELLLGEQRLGLGLGDQEVDRRDPVDHLRRREWAAREVARDPLADRGRLADVQDLARRGRRTGRPPADRAAACAARRPEGDFCAFCAHRSKVRVRHRRQCRSRGAHSAQ